VTAPTPVRVREAGLEDAAALAGCQLDCWRETYTGMVDAALLAAALGDVEGRVARWRAVLSTEHGTRLAEDDGEVVGFASTGPQRDVDNPEPSELYALYVRRSHQGRGIGHRLLTAAVGDAASSLWVFRDNHQARDFYARHGYAPDGVEAWEEHFGAVEIRMVRPAGPTAG
jgi:GNAT superfamily N-acetyltransferase